MLRLGWDLGLGGIRTAKKSRYGACRATGIGTFQQISRWGYARSLPLRMLMLLERTRNASTTQSRIIVPPKQHSHF